MITDRETNFVYLSELLIDKCPQTYRQLKHWFDKLDIKYGTLPNTKDLWVVDFMPVQVREDYYVQYKYDPDYLKPAVHTLTKTDPHLVCEGIGISPSKVTIVLDGGNIVKCKNKVIVTTKVFKENAGYPEANLINEIKNQLNVEQVIVIPQEPKDHVGHSDGMVRFIDENTVLINKYPENNTYKEYGMGLRWSLKNAGLEYSEFPYNSWKNKNGKDATGCYINFLELGKYIFFPTFGEQEDYIARIRLQDLFEDRELIEIDCRDLAPLGGVLNCITWNIKSKC